MFIFSKIHTLFQSWNSTNLPHRETTMLTKGKAIKKSWKRCDDTKAQEENPGKIHIRRRATPSRCTRVAKARDCTSKISIRGEHDPAAEIVRKRELTTRQWTSPGKEAISRRGTWSTDKDFDLFSILRSVELVTRQTLEHDGCKTVSSSLWIVWSFETWWIYRAFFPRWMELV